MQVIEVYRRVNEKFNAKGRQGIHPDQLIETLTIMQLKGELEVGEDGEVRKVVTGDGN